MFEIEFYQLPNGEKPVENFLNKLSPKMRVKAIDSLDILEEFGHTLREPYTKPMQDGIFELRIQFASDISRIFYFFYVDKKIILTNGFIKKTRRTPKRELTKAIKYKSDYERRHHDERPSKV